MKMKISISMSGRLLLLIGSQNCCMERNLKPYVKVSKMTLIEFSCTESGIKRNLAEAMREKILHIRCTILVKFSVNFCRQVIRKILVV